MKYVIIVASLLAYVQGSWWNNGNVTIAVVEYQPILNPKLSKIDRVQANTARYIEMLESSRRNRSLDMIVFPEDTLRNDPETSVELRLLENPCDNKDEHSDFVCELSCAARKARTYVVVNLVQKVKCQNANQGDNCKNFGHFFYNTDVVFDREGTIVNLYHKYNLFGERELDTPPTPEEVVVKTDFGIDLGIFTCFDIMFKSPAQDLLRNDVDAVIFPSMWFSQLPFLTALQTQQMWAYTHDMKLFSAGANNPQAGSGGTGVFDGTKGTILEDIVAGGGSRVYVYENINPKPTPNEDTDILGKEMDDFRMSVDPSVAKYNSTILELTRGTSEVRVCHGDGVKNQICCDFATKITTATPKTRFFYTYHLVAYSGVRPFNQLRHGGIEICGIIACLNSSLSSCGRRFPKYEDTEWPVKFERIEISANFEISENRTQYPNSLLSSIRPISADQTNWEGREVEIDGKKFIERTFTLEKAQDRLLTFAIFGRNFVQDATPNNGSFVQLGGITWILSISAIVLSVFAFK